MLQVTMNKTPIPLAPTKWYNINPVHQMGPRPARPRDDPTGARLRRRPGQEAPRRTDPLDPRPDASADPGMYSADTTHTHTHTMGWKFYMEKMC